MNFILEHCPINLIHDFLQDKVDFDYLIHNFHKNIKSEFNFKFKVSSENYYSIKKNNNITSYVIRAIEESQFGEIKLQVSEKLKNDLLNYYAPEKVKYYEILDLFFIEDINYIILKYLFV